MSICSAINLGLKTIAFRGGGITTAKPGCWRSPTVSHAAEIALKERDGLAMAKTMMDPNLRAVDVVNADTDALLLVHCNQ